MEKLTLIRCGSTNEGTIGVVNRNGLLFCLSLELPWDGNKRNISCIPPGSYRCSITNSPHFGKVYEVNNVSGRSHILMHKGNTSEDTEGCILLGMCLGSLDDKMAVLRSGAAFQKLYRELMLQPFILEIKEGF